jgi:predicted membrane protein
MDDRHTMIVGVRYKPAMTGRLILGLVVMTLGVLWTLDNLGLIESEPILRWWPAVLVAIGAAKLLGFATRRNPVAGAIFSIIGLWMLAEQFDMIRVSFWTMWPLALVAIGIGMLTRSAVRPSDPSQADDRAAKLSAFAFMSGVVRKIASSEFEGGDVTAVMGGVKLDLRGAKSAPGGAIIDVMVCWGGIDIVVPDTWRVVNEATVLLGGLEDQTKTPPPDARDTLILRGVVVMGGIEVKN